MKITMKALLLAIFTFSFCNICCQNNKITLSDIWKERTFLPESIDEIRSTKDGEKYTILKENKILQYSYKKGELEKVIVDGNNLKVKEEKDIIIEDYHFSEDETMLLLATSTESIYRHSSISEFFVCDIHNGNFFPLSKKGKQGLAEFSPDNKKIAFVRNNNIHIFDIENKEETQITKDGEFNKIIYGAPDWVYEEEFSFSKGFFWSPDATKLAYYRFDETKVNYFQFDLYNGNAYPEIYKYKYPKAGEDNSCVDIFVYDLKKDSLMKMDTGEEVDQYLPRVQWTTTSSKLSIQRLNRLQNYLELLLADTKTGKSEVIYKEENKYYIDITDNLTFLENGKQFVITSEKDGYNHIYLYDIKGNLLRQITQGEWDVQSLSAIDENNKLIYYLSYEDGPLNTMLYSISFDGKKKTKLFAQSGNYNADFSSNHKYFILSYSNSSTPPQYGIYKANGKKIKMLEENTELIDKLKDYEFSPKEFFSFTASDDIHLNGWMIKPNNIEDGKRYPVLMYVYGGPGSQTVVNNWSYSDLWFQMLTQKGFIVVSVDNRGTGGRGEEFEKCTYLQLGNLETIDLIETAKYLSALPYVDKEKISIFGWSYGGYLSALCITKGADYFYSAISVAPVTNWRYYDNIYTERFMRKPQDNAERYDKNAPMHYADKLKGKFLLIHGGADDNVHVQNTMELADALVKANKPFNMFIYPNKNHGIHGGFSRYHLYNMMTNFLTEE